MQQLNKSLTLFGLTMVAIGGSIGSGIFLTPSGIAAQLPNAGLILLVWVVGGVVSLTGALTFAELGGMFTGSGGVYVYLKEAYGEWVAFLYGWCIFTVITSGAIAALALAFTRYVSFVVPMESQGIQLLGIVAIIAVTVINMFGVKAGEWFASIFTGMKLLGILLIVLVGVWFYFAEKPGHLSFAMPSVQATPLAVALIGVIWSYGGWHHASYVAGETANPSRTVPLAMLLGALVVTATYLLINVAYLLLLPIERIAASQAVAADSVGQVFAWGGVFVALLIAISTFGTAGIYTLTAPRIYFAMAQDGVFFKQLAAIHPVWHTPVYAIGLQSAWAVVLLLFWGTFENLIAYVVFMDWLFMTLAAFSIFLFRKKQPERARLYRAFGYPVVPWVFVGISSLFLIFTLFGKPDQAWAGLILLAAGVVVYWFFKKHKRASQLS